MRHVGVFKSLEFAHKISIGIIFLVVCIEDVGVWDEKAPVGIRTLHACVRRFGVCIALRGHLHLGTELFPFFQFSPPPLSGAVLLELSLSILEDTTYT